MSKIVIPRSSSRSYPRSRHAARLTSVKRASRSARKNASGASSMTSCVCAADRSASLLNRRSSALRLVERATPSRRQMRDVNDDEPVDRVQERLKDRFMNRVSRADDEHVGGNRQAGHERDQARSAADVQTRYEHRREEQDKRGACPRQRREQNTQRKRGRDRAECDEITRNGVSRRTMIGLIAHRRRENGLAIRTHHRFSRL